MRGKARQGSAQPSQAPAFSRIPDGFDWAKLRKHVEALDKARAATQPELAEAYDTDMLNAIVTDFPHVSLDDIILGIAAQDPRMLQHGQTLLGRRLRSRGREGATS